MIIATPPAGALSSIGVELAFAVVCEASSLVFDDPVFWAVVPLSFDADAVSVADAVPLDRDPVSETVADLSD